MEEWCLMSIHIEVYENIMKKILFLLLGVLLFSSCGIKDVKERIARAKEDRYNVEREASDNDIQEAKDFLRRAAKGVDTPMKVDYMTILISCEFDGNNIVYEYIVNEDYATISELKESEDDLRESIEDGLKKESVQEMINNLNKIDGKVIYKYYGNHSGEKIVIEIEP